MTAATQLERAMNTSISMIYSELYRNAKRTRRERHATLATGVGLSVQVANGVITVVLSRPGSLVSSSEEELLKLECGIPAQAIRLPATGQLTRCLSGRQGATAWHYVAFRWRETVEPAAA